MEKIKLKHEDKHTQKLGYYPFLGSKIYFALNKNLDSQFCHYFKLTGLCKIVSVYLGLIVDGAAPGGGAPITVQATNFSLPTFTVIPSIPNSSCLLRCGSMVNCILLDCWFAGLLVGWLAGLLGCWIAGLLLLSWLLALDWCFTEVRTCLYPPSVVQFSPNFLWIMVKINLVCATIPLRNYEKIHTWSSEIPLLCGFHLK